MVCVCFRVEEVGMGGWRALPAMSVGGGFTFQQIRRLGRLQGVPACPAFLGLDLGRRVQYLDDQVFGVRIGNLRPAVVVGKSLLWESLPAVVAGRCARRPWRRVTGPSFP